MRLRLNFVILTAFLGLPGAAIAQTPSPLPEPSAMSRRELQTELTQLRAIVQGGGVRGRRPASCTAPENRQFDFWIGEWDVTPAGSTIVIAESSVTLHDQECVLIENWRPFTGGHAHSINTYDPNDHHWHQAYSGAGGNAGSSIYIGDLDAEGVMRLDLNGASPATRMNFQRLDANTTRQWGEQRDAQSGAWIVTFDFYYHRRAQTPPAQ